MSSKSVLFALCAAPLGIVTSSAFADQVINDDLIVTMGVGGGSVCVGANCTEDMDFGCSSVIIDNPDGSILFQDTSNSASFPTTDWRVGTQSSDGAFYIENEDTGTQVLTVGSDGNAIALGGSATLVDGAVTIGGLRVSNVADGVEDTDAVNLGQLNAALAGTTFADDIAATGDQLAENEEQLVILEQRIDDVGAMGSAMSGLQMNPRGKGDHFFSAGLGYYSGSSAVALGSFHFFNDDRIFVNTGISTTTNGRNGVAARAGITFGR